MNITIKCKVSLSKKLRKLVGKDGRITLVTSDLSGGIGEGKLMLYSDDSNFNGEVSIDKAETSIMITPEAIEEAMPSPSVNGVGSLFSSIPAKGEEEKLVRSIAAVHAPEQHEVPVAITPKENIVPINQVLNNEGYRRFASNIDELMGAVASAKSKEAAIDVDSIVDPRKRALAKEDKERLEAIDLEAWVVNTKCGRLEIADLGITLMLYMPFDLSKISAKRISASKDLQAFIRNGWIKFLNPSDTQSWVQKAEASQKDYSIPVFDRDEAEANSASNGLGIDYRERVVAGQYGNRVATTSGQSATRNSMEITEADLNMPTEEEAMIQNLIGGGVQPTQSSAPGMRRTSHGQGGPANARPSNNPINLTGSASRTIAGSSGESDHKSIRRVDE
jgi:hypothetical protein